jgi:integrase
MTHSTIPRIVKHYVGTAQIRTPDLKLALNVHPHLFRHHVATSMVNDNVPLTVIQKVLDHGSMRPSVSMSKARPRRARRPCRARPQAQRRQAVTSTARQASDDRDSLAPQ